MTSAEIEKLIERLHNIVAGLEQFVRPNYPQYKPSQRVLSQTTIEAWHRIAKEAADALAAQQGRVEDAERYRWLRLYEWDLIVLPKFVSNPPVDGYEHAASPNELDSAIDAARREGKA